MDEKTFEKFKSIEERTPGLLEDFLIGIGSNKPPADKLEISQRQHEQKR